MAGLIDAGIAAMAQAICRGDLSASRVQRLFRVSAMVLPGALPFGSVAGFVASHSFFQ